MIGNGTFGVVYIATLYETGDKIAIKKVEIDKRFKVNPMKTIVKGPNYASYEF